ncbi:MAG: Cytochrome c-552 [Verrucomicrobia subdivision 3 bacterium]|nr:Cytochrome c-552 [Limisphaerales bacterium]MCS1415038.1 Cytochrome c-552 [Limisphaerales bacterium]
MTDSSNQDLPEFEPTASRAPVPAVFFVVFVVLFYLSTLYLDSNAGGFDANVYEPFASYDVVKAIQPKGNLDLRFEKGRMAYAAYCSPCHQNNGAGRPGQFPPLAGSDWVTAEGPNRIIRVVLNGLMGPIVVSGQDWNPPAQMLSWRELSDEEIACIVTYIRGQSEWGNHASAVTAEQVAAIRAEVVTRNTPWTQAELFETPEQ